MSNNNLRGFDPILEMDEYEKNNDESFFNDINENTQLFNDMKEQSQSDNDVNISCNFPHDTPLSMIGLEEESVEFVGRLRNNLMNVQLNSNLNKSVFVPEKRKAHFFAVNNGSNLSTSKPIHKVKFNYTTAYNQISQSSISNSNVQTNNVSFIGMNHPTNDKLLNTSTTNSNLSIDYKNNSASNLSLNASGIPKKGRKKTLLEGVKTELLEKAFLREFKSFVVKSNALKQFFDDLKPEEKQFWNEFINHSAPPFVFTINNRKEEFKSYNKRLLRYIFSLMSVRNLYEIYIKDREKEIVYSIFNKKSQKNLDKKTLHYYSLYCKNLHKIYSPESVDLDLDCDTNMHDTETYQHGGCFSSAISSTAASNYSNQKAISSISNSNASYCNIRRQNSKNIIIQDNYLFENPNQNIPQESIYSTTHLNSHSSVHNLNIISNSPMVKSNHPSIMNLSGTTKSSSMFIANSNTNQTTHYCSHISNSDF